MVRPRHLTRFEGDPGRVAIVLPGGGYTPARPLLHFARAVLMRHGWTVQEVWWELPPGTWADDLTEALTWVRGQATSALDADASAERVLIVGKSLGSLAAPVALEHGLPAVWLTPILTSSEVASAVAETLAPTLLVGGTADGYWDGPLVRRLGHPFLEIPGADHSLESPDEPLASTRFLTQVAAAVDEFVSAL